MPSIYRTARGNQIDMDRLRLANETTVAVGNQRVNARGDRLDEKGNIVKAKDDVMSEHYRSRVRSTPPKDQPIIDNSTEARKATAAEADVLDSKKLQETIASLSKQLAEKDAEVRSLNLKAAEPTDRHTFYNDVDSPLSEAGVSEPRSGLADAIKKNLKKKQRA